MRWTKPAPDLRPSHLDERVVTKFAWVPITIKREVRWLETVNIVQRYWSPRYGTGKVIGDWVNSKFI